MKAAKTYLIALYGACRVRIPQPFMALHRKGKDNYSEPMPRKRKAFTNVDLWWNQNVYMALILLKSNDSSFSL